MSIASLEIDKKKRKHKFVPFLLCTVLHHSYGYITRSVRGDGGYRGPTLANQVLFATNLKLHGLLLLYIVGQGLSIHIA